MVGYQFATEDFLFVSGLGLDPLKLCNICHDCEHFMATFYLLWIELKNQV